jgi:hypothetical protein
MGLQTASRRLDVDSGRKKLNNDPVEFGRIEDRRVMKKMLAFHERGQCCDLRTPGTTCSEVKECS